MPFGVCNTMKDDCGKEIHNHEVTIIGFTANDGRICPDFGCDRHSVVHYAACVKKFKFDVVDKIDQERQRLFEETGIDIR